MQRNLGFLLLLGACVLSAQQTDTRPAQPGPMSPEGFSETHRSLFVGPASDNVGSLTESLVGSNTASARAALAPVARRNFIDEQIFGKIERDGIPHAPMADDREFIRRVTLDLTGRLPSTTDLRDFLADNTPGKRERLTARLLDSPEFVDKWAYFFMDLLRANGKMGKGHQLFHYMMKESLAADRPYDDLVRSIISASAKSNLVVAAVNPVVREHVEGKPGQVEHGDDLAKVQQLDTHDELTVLFGKAFLGINLSCISCHDGARHLEKVNAYLTSKKRSDFFQQAAFWGHARYIPHVEHTEAIMGHFIVDDLASGYDTQGPSMLRMPPRRPRRSTGITFDMRKLKITPCMPERNPSSPRKMHMATRFAVAPRKNPASATPSTCTRISEPIVMPIGSTRRRCSISVAESSGERHCPSD